METRLCFVSRSAPETHAIGERLGRALRPGDVLALTGSLGAGKTALVQGIARGLDVDEAAPVTSPTFTLVGEYPGRIPLRHADFYRVESYERLFSAGFDDLFDGAGVVAVEWPERFPDAMPRELLEIRIEFESAEARRLELTPRGARAEALVDELGAQADTRC